MEASVLKIPAALTGVMRVKQQDMEAQTGQNTPSVPALKYLTGPDDQALINLYLIRPGTCVCVSV